ncbi:MAG TPA: MMPL family transporter [Candidatus Saccharimonadales bacterium]|nr:MMPL family transporter [Candidatus Saccharimonadales bacterium]
MQKFADFIIKRRWWVLAFWLVATVLIVSFSPKLSSVESNDQSSFIPKKYESIKALGVASQLSKRSMDASDLIVFKSKSGQPLNQTELAKIQSISTDLSSLHIKHVAAVTTSPQQIAPTRKAQLVTVTYSGNPDDTTTINAVKGVRTNVKKLTNGTTLVANTTGQESIGFDTQDASNRALKIVSLGTLLIVLILPAIIFRSPLAGLLPIVSIGIVDLIASSLIADAATLFDFKVNQQLSVIFTVVLYGIGTDYILFLLFRYRERLRSGDHTRGAAAFALSRAGLAILSAALVVLTSFAALFFASFGIFSSMAPGLVICVSVMMLAALTLIPAVVGIVGQKVFWPSKAWKSASMKPTFSKKIGGLVARRPGLVATSVILFLVILGSFAFGFRSDFSSFSKPPAGTQSSAGYNDLLKAFPAGVTDPAQIYVAGNMQLTQATLMPLQQKLTQTQGVAAVLPATIGPNGKVAVVPVILKDNPYSGTAIANVKGPIRDAAHSANVDGAKVYVGGTSSIFADIQAVSARDLRVLFPIAAVFILVILAVLLRSLVAPVFLLLGVGLGYLATLGATTLIFQHLGNDPGLIFFIPIFMYIFVVAIGTDYNILTVTRLREEIQAGRNPRKAADLTIEHSSATVASAGLILAATFGSLLLANISFLTQMGTAIALGVIISAFIIAPFLIPSISALVGYFMWWPGNKAARVAAKSKR